MPYMKNVFCPICGGRMRYVRTKGPYTRWFDAGSKKVVTAEQVGSRIVREFWACLREECSGPMGRPTVSWFDIRIDKPMRC